jgi:hypothetical protein
MCCPRTRRRTDASCEHSSAADRSVWGVRLAGKVQHRRKTVGGVSGGSVDRLSALGHRKVAEGFVFLARRCRFYKL